MRIPGSLALLSFLTTTVAASGSPSKQDAQAPLYFDIPVSSMPSLLDVLPQRQTQIFSTLIRDDASLTSLLSAPNANFTVLAPSNSAMNALPRKPWEDPAEYDSLGPNAYEGSSGRERAERNIERFVQVHIVKGGSGWKAGEEEKRETAANKKVWWTEKDGGRVIMPDGVQVDSVEQQVSNGEVWVLKGTLKTS